MQFVIQNLPLLFLRSLIWNRVYVIEEQHTISNPKRKTLRFDQCLLSALLYHNKKKECSPYAYGLILPTHAYSPQFVCVCNMQERCAHMCSYRIAYVGHIWSNIHIIHILNQHIYSKTPFTHLFVWRSRRTYIVDQLATI